MNHETMPRAPQPFPSPTPAPAPQGRWMDVLAALAGVALTVAVLGIALQQHRAQLDRTSAQMASTAARQWLQPLPAESPSPASTRPAPLTAYVLSGLFLWVSLTVGSALLRNQPDQPPQHEPEMADSLPIPIRTTPPSRARAA